jgi:hypothetical protein
MGSSSSSTDWYAPVRPDPMLGTKMQALDALRKLLSNHDPDIVVRAAELILQYTTV